MSYRYRSEILDDILVRAVRQIAAGSFLLLAGTSAAFGQGGGSSQDQIVQSFYPATLQQEIDNNPNRWGYLKAWCSAAYDATTIMAAYSNGVQSNISVLQQQSDGSYAVGFSLTGANLGDGHCAVNIVDLNGDGVPEVQVSFIGIHGNNDDWFFTWNGTNLVSIGPVDTTAGVSTTEAVNSQLVDVLHNGTIQLIVPG